MTMNSHKNKPLGHTMLRTKVAASAALLSLALSASAAHAAPQKAPLISSGVYVTILSPMPGSSYDGSKQVEVSAFYQASANDGGVTTLELYIDGRRAAEKQLDSPEARGVVSFLIDPTVLSPGSHHVVVRASAADAEVSSAATSLSIAGDSQAPAGLSADLSATPPQLFITSPAPDTTVSGMVKIDVNAHDDSGKPPYVSLFVDHAFKTLRNYPPFAFEWDTTRVANGYHTIEVYGYNDAQQVGHAEPLRVLVNNPGGHTIVRHDLSDTPLAPAKAATRKALPVLKTHPLVARSIGAKPAPANLKAAHPLLAEGQIGAGQRALPTSPVLLTDNEMAETFQAPSDLGQISPATLPTAAPAAKPAKSTKAQAAAKTGQAAPMLAQDRPGKALPVAFPQMLASANLGAPAEDEDSQVLLSSPFIHPPAARTATAPPRAARPVIHPSLARPAVSRTGAATVQLASAGLQEGNLAPQELFDGTAQTETPHLGPSVGSMPTHRFSASARFIPLSSDTTDPRVLARARGAYRVVMNDQMLTLDRPVQARGAFLFAPFRQIFESEGGELLWIPGDKKIQAVSPTRQIELTIGSRDALVNNQMLALDQAPYLFWGRTMVPLSFLPMALDVSVSFDASTGHLVINSKK